MLDLESQRLTFERIFSENKEYVKANDPHSRARGFFVAFYNDGNLLMDRHVTSAGDEPIVESLIIVVHGGSPSEAIRLAIDYADNFIEQSRHEVAKFFKCESLSEIKVY